MVLLGVWCVASGFIGKCCAIRKNPMLDAGCQVSPQTCPVHTGFPQKRTQISNSTSKIIHSGPRCRWPTPPLASDHGLGKASWKKGAGGIWEKNAECPLLDVGRPAWPAEREKIFRQGKPHGRAVSHCAHQCHRYSVFDRGSSGLNSLKSLPLFDSHQSK